MSTRHRNLSLRILAGLELALLVAVVLAGIKLVFTNLGLFVCTWFVRPLCCWGDGWRFLVPAAGAVGVCSSRSEVCWGCLF